MLDIHNLPQQFRGDLQIFSASSSAAGVGWASWTKPRGVSMAYIMVLGGGGGGGNGAVGANSTAAGGGGGGSSGQTAVLIPTMFLPDTLFISVGIGGLAAAGVASRVAVAPDTVANNCIALANGGAAGGNASGATAGAAGAAGAVATIATMPLAGLGTVQLLAGQAGIIGGVAVAAANLTLPTTGLTMTGGTGGGGLPAAAASGTAGGNITGAGVLPTALGGAAQATATNPGNPGSNGLTSMFRGLEYSYGGTGGGSSHGTATGGGLVGGKGGNGGLGSGGGGGGGCLTGGVAGTGGRGGDGQVIILCW